MTDKVECGHYQQPINQWSPHVFTSVLGNPRHHQWTVPLPLTPFHFFCLALFPSYSFILSVPPPYQHLSRRAGSSYEWGVWMVRVRSKYSVMSHNYYLGLFRIAKMQWKNPKIIIRIDFLVGHTFQRGNETCPHIMTGDCTDAGWKMLTGTGWLGGWLSDWKYGGSLWEVRLRKKVKSESW